MRSNAKQPSKFEQIHALIEFWWGKLKSAVPTPITPEQLLVCFEAAAKAVKRDYERVNEGVSFHEESMIQGMTSSYFRARFGDFLCQAAGIPRKSYPLSSFSAREERFSNPPLSAAKAHSTYH